MSADKMRKLNAILDDFHSTPESYLLDLQMSFAEFVSNRLKARGWTQRRLAREAGMAESYISRVLGGENVELETIARILFALKARARIAEFVPVAVPEMEQRYGTKESRWATSRWKNAETETAESDFHIRFTNEFASRPCWGPAKAG